MVSRKLRDGYYFRVEKKFMKEKAGLYFDNIFRDKGRPLRMTDREVTEIRDFLSRYLKRDKPKREIFIETRANARKVLRGLDSLEAKR